MNKKKTALLALGLAALIATVSAGIYVWQLQVTVPIIYDEPVHFYFSDETQPEGVWIEIPVGTFDYVTGPVDLTDYVFEDYLRAVNTAERDVGIQVTITAYNKSNGEMTELVGFNLIETNATGLETPIMAWGSLTLETVIPAETAVEGTLHYILSASAPLGSTDIEVVWNVYRFEPLT